MLGLRKALVGIMIVFYVIFFFAYLLPVVFRIINEPTIKSLEESFLEVGERMGAILGGLVWLVLAIIAIVLAIWFFIVLLPTIFRFSPWKQGSDRGEALDVLKMRYAKGELTKEQYLDMKKTLENA